MATLSPSFMKTCITGWMNPNLVTTLAPTFLIGSSSFLEVTRTTIKAGMS